VGQLPSPRAMSRITALGLGRVKRLWRNLIDLQSPPLQLGSFHSAFCLLGAGLALSGTGSGVMMTGGSSLYLRRPMSVLRR
jgi:hypothetical protein